MWPGPQECGQSLEAKKARKCIIPLETQENAGPDSPFRTSDHHNGQREVCVVSSHRICGKFGIVATGP